jgi:alpha-methylacyl-CoA racemase
LLAGLGLDPARLPGQYDRANWTQLRTLLTDVFLTRTRDAWMQTFEQLDACVSPVLTIEEAHRHPHNQQRATFTPRGAAAAPRLSRTPGRPPSAERRIDAIEQLLVEWRDHE